MAVEGKIWEIGKFYDNRENKKLIRRFDTLNVTSLYSATPLAFNAPTEGFPRDDLHKILQDGRRMAKIICWHNMAR